jgi:class 3 adenylate cyclase
MMGPVPVASTLWDAEVEEQLRLAVVLDRIFIATMVVLGAVTIGQVALGAIDPLLSVNIIVIALLAGLRVAVRRGHVHAVSVGLVAVTWSLATVAVCFDGGIRSPSMGAYLVILMMASLLLRARALWVMLGLSAAVAIGLLIADLQALLPAPQSADTPVRAFAVHVIHLLAASLFLFMAVESLQQARERARRNQDRATTYLAELEIEKERADDLLRNILPDKIADQLKRKVKSIAERFESATVLFADLAHFTAFAADRPPEAVVELLGDIFSRFDALADRFGLEKIKTIGDAYMVVAGIPSPRADHVEAMAEMALAIRVEFDQFIAERGLVGLGLRIGIHCGPVVAGVIGRRKFIYDLWGDTVNMASRMESTGVIGEIQVSEAVAAALRGRYECSPRGVVAVKGKGELQVFLLREKAT